MIAELETIREWAEQRPETNPAIQAAYLRLAACVLEQAVRDAAAQTPQGYQARMWLLSDDAALYLESLSIDRDALERWIRSGARIPGRE